MKLFNKIAYHSTTQKGLNKFDDSTSEEKAFTGEGAMVHGWGLYLQADKEINVKRYKQSMYRTINTGHIMVSEIYYEFVIDGEILHTTNSNIRYARHEMNNGSVFTYPNEYKKLSSELYLFLTNKSFNGYEIANRHNFDELPKLISDIQDVDSFFKDVIDNMNGAFPDFKSYVEAVGSTLKEIRIRWKEETKDEYASQYTVEIPDDMVFVRERDEMLWDDNLNNICDELGINGGSYYEERRNELLERIRKLYPEIPSKTILNMYNWYYQVGVDSAVESIIREANNPDDIGYYYEGFKNIENKEDVIRKIVSDFFPSVAIELSAEIRDYQDLYNEIAKKLNSRKKASEYLYQHGIDGITYDGRRDGECYVIFNCSKLKIVSEE